MDIDKARLSSWLLSQIFNGKNSRYKQHKFLPEAWSIVPVRTLGPDKEKIVEDTWHN